MPSAPAWTRDVVLLLARLVVGVVFVAHGLQKFLQWGVGGTASAFAEMGVPASNAAAWAAALIETLGGAALIVGLALPLAGTLLAATMIGAVVFAHLGNGLFASSGGFEYVLVLAVTALALGFGARAYSLDGAMRGTREPKTTGEPVAG